MPRLLLASWGIGALADFVGRPASEVRVAFVPTAAADFPDAEFLQADRARLRALGYRVTDLDLVGLGPDEVADRLRDADVLHVTGGNTFMLLHHMRQSGLAALLPGALADGLLYVGVSAGAVVVGPDCEPVSEIDDLDAVPELESTAGLGLVDCVVLSHYGAEDDMPLFTRIVERYGSRYEIVLLRDEQAVRVEPDGSRAVIPSP
jgi:dipeptidase E